MDHKREKTYSISNRIGFHYFPDSLHYGEKDVELWLPRLKQLNAQWLVLDSPANRAIPEDFISAFSQSRIKTILNFDHPLFEEPVWPDLETLLRSYGKWGVNYALLDQRPNDQKAWGSNFWKQPDLAGAYTRRFIHFAQIALDCGVKPVFAPLIPGGDYWDLAFLENGLKILADASNSFILNNTALSAFAWDFNRSLNWGAGGPKVWQEVKAYKVPEASQDQRGFRAYEWYAQVSQNILGKTLPIMLLQAGLTADPQSSSTGKLSSGSEKQQMIYQLLREENVFDPENPEKLISAIAPEVLACNFYALSEESGGSSAAWFSPDGDPRPTAQAVLDLLSKVDPNAINHPAEESKEPTFKYDSYILIADSLRPRIREILQKLHVYITRHKPLIGFSVSEAQKSASILLIAYENEVTDEFLNDLKSSGSIVKVVNPENLTVEMNPFVR